MAHSTLVIGVGGGGKGICNHIKYECERVYGSLEKANTFILSMDGLGHDGDYILPGEFEINSDAGSDEYYKFSNDSNPTERLTRIAKGDPQAKSDVMAQWLTPDQANKVLKAGHISPSAGFGGHRVPGHAFVYVDYLNIKDILSKKINVFKKNAQSQSDMKIIFLVGTQVGGTGAGILSDIATILSDIIKNESQMWIWNLYPLSDTYAKLNSSTFDRSVKGFSAFLNLLRMNSLTSTQFPLYIKYSESYTVRVDKYIHVPFVVDGEGKDYKYNTVPPQRGVIPIMSDFIFTYIKDCKENAAIQSQVVNYPSCSSGKKSALGRFATFGHYSLQYPWQEVNLSFKYRYANSFYRRVFDREYVARKGGISIADKLQSLNAFMRNLITLEFSIWNRKNITDVLEHLLKSNSNNRKKPSLEGLMNVKMTNIWPFTRSATDFKNETQAVQESYLKEVKDFLQVQRGKIMEDLVRGIAKAIEEIFYVRDKEGTLLPKDLKTDPGSILVFVAFLEKLIDLVKKFKDKLEGDYEKFQSEADKVQQAANNKMKVLGDTGTKRQLEEYLEGLVEYTKVQAWRLTIDSINGLTVNLIKYLETFYSRVGDSANGWIGIFREYEKETRKLWEQEDNIRKQRAEWLGRTYFPKPGGLAEDKLFEDVADPILDSMMEKVHWNICGLKADGKLIDAGQLVNPQKMVIILSIPNAGKTATIPEEYRNVITDEWLKVTRGYSFYDHIQYSENYIPAKLENFNIWQIMEIDCLSGHMRSGSIEESERNPAGYINKYRNKLIYGANFGISGTALSSSSGDNNESSYIFAPSTLAITTIPNQNMFLQNLFTTVNAQAVDTSGFSKHEIRLLNLRFNVEPTKTNSFTQGQVDYLADMKKPLLPVNIYSNEQNAERLRRVVESYIDRNFQRVFIPQVISLLNDYLETYFDGERPELTHVFEKFSLCYLSEILFAKECTFQKNITAVKQIKLTGKNNIQGYILGDIWNLPEITQKVMRFEYDNNKTWLENPARKQIVEIWRKKEEELIKEGKFTEYLTELRDKALGGEINTEKEHMPANEFYDFEIDDLLLAMRASVIEYTNAALRNLK